MFSSMIYVEEQNWSEKDVHIAVDLCAAILLYLHKLKTEVSCSPFCF